MIEWMNAHSPEMGVLPMLGRKRREQMDLFVAGSLERLIPEDHVLKRVDRVLDLSWLPRRWRIAIAWTTVVRGSTRRWRCG